VKTARFIILIVIPFLFACFPKKPELPLSAVSAEPVLQALERHRQSFSGLKAVASVEVAKGGRKRILDTVGIVVDDERRLRIEAYGPLGQSLSAIVWDGREILMRRPGEDRVVRPGPKGLERLFGQGVEASELCALLAGNIPGTGDAAAARLLCGKDGMCVLELQTDDGIRQVRVSTQPAESAREPRVLSYALYRAGKLMFQVHFDRYTDISHYALPVQIVIENPDKKLHVTVTYSEAEVNIPLSDDAFTLADGEEAATAH
jgi:outer membrane lipoprotein-sorting protein